MKKQNLLLLLLAACGIFPLYASSVYTVQTVPNPKQQGQDYYVSNPDSVIDGRYETYVNSLCCLADEKSEAEVCVVLINRFDEDRWDAYNFALDLFNDWGIGKAENNSGVLVFLAKNSRDIQIITGGGVEGLLPDAVCSEIWHNAAEDYLSEGNYNEGVPYIVDQIVKILVSDEAQAELLLGWKPRDASVHEDTANYLIFGFILLIVFAIVSYRKLNGKPGESKAQIMQAAAGTQTAIGCLSWIFPVALLPLYLYYRKSRKGIRNRPEPCPECGTLMQLAPNKAEAGYLSPVQLAEEHLQSVDYDIWVCPSCHQLKAIGYKGKTASRYDHCPQCNAMAYETVSRNTVRHASYTASGLREDTMQCAYCGYKQVKPVVLPKLVRSSGGSSGGYGGGGGGSHRSSGGGGSWGGGCSFGGGSGGKF